MKHDISKGLLLALVLLGAGLSACEDDSMGRTLCGDTECLDGQTCVDNSKCVDTSLVCGDLVCEENEVCKDGKCEAKPVTDPCDGVVCEENEVCKDGKCEAKPVTDPCDGVVCEKDEVCKDGKCEAKPVTDPCDGVVCLEEQTCKEGVCHDNACILADGTLKACGEGQVCSRGECVDDGCADVTCLDTETCVKGVCEETACIGVFCEVGQSCKGGECMDNNCLTVTCPEGDICRDARCIPEACREIVCQQDKECQADGSCAFNTAPALQVAATNEDTKTSEDGKTVSVEVVLNHQPASDVIVHCTSSDETEGTVECNVKFDGTNWNQPQLITVTGVKDSIMDGDQKYTVQFVTESEDAEFNALESEIDLTNQDTTKNGVAINAPEELITYEDSSKDPLVIQLSLTSAPEKDVTFKASSSNEAEGILDKTEFVFTPENWNEPQSLTITGQNDEDADGSKDYQIIFTNTVSEDLNWNDLAIDPIDIINQDDDAPGVTIPQKIIHVDENRKSVALPVVLNTKPKNDVTVTIVSSNENEATVDQASLTFTAENWNTPQVVNVAGVVDNVIDGKQEFTITFTFASEDADYNALEPIVIKGDNNDTDKANVVIVSDGKRDVPESETATFAISLSSIPTDEVTLSLISEDTSRLIVAGDAKFVFTPENWNVAQTVTVQAVNNDIMDGNKKVQIRVTGSSNDKEFNKLSTGAITYTVIDDDVAGILVSGDSKALREEASETSTFTVQLSSQPKSNVTLSLASTDSSELVIDGSTSLTFTTSNWNKPQTVKVKSVDDTQADGNQNVSISLTATSSDANYNKKIVSSPIYTVVDNESASLVLTPTSFTINNPNNVSAVANHTITVRLGSQPTGDVKVSIESSAPSILNATNTLTFTSSNWDTNQVITFNGTCSAALSKVNLTVKSTSVSSTSYNDPLLAKVIPVTLTCGTTTQTLTYTGTCATQTRVLFPGKYKFQVWGAQGGDGVGGKQDVGSHGGLGGYSEGIITINEKTTAYIWIGEQGKRSTTTDSIPLGGAGCNGGGNGANNGSSYGYAGGGATDIRLGTDSLYARVIVAGGGGGTDDAGGAVGTTNDGSGGYGGGTVAGAGRINGVIGDPVGATQTTGYKFGIGQEPPLAYAQQYHDVGGGGGGWFGGFHGKTNNGGASGGSGFVYIGNPDVSAATIGGTWLLNNSHKFTSANTYDGSQTFPAPNGGTEQGHAGNGYAIITLLDE